MVYAAFVHMVSRPIDGIPDPHYHIHGYVFNATFDPVEEQEGRAIYEPQGRCPLLRSGYRDTFRLLLTMCRRRRTSNHLRCASPTWRFPSF
jgi:hypothetical protein